MSTETIPVFKPVLDESEIGAAVASLEAGWLGMGKSVGEFETMLGEYLGLDMDRHVVAVNTGHSALHLGLLLAGVGEGDEVITPSFNNISDLQAILACGATPVFCDILEDTLCIDPDQVEELISPRTKCIIAMDYACFTARHEKIGAIAKRNGLRVIHDAAHSLGSFHGNRKIGADSDICMFSFDPVKTITCIDGGALVVRGEEAVRSLQEMRLIGMGQPSEVMYENRRAWTYDVRQLGFRYHMANLHAAIGLAQLAQIDEFIETRRKACRRYNRRLSNLPGLSVPQTDFSTVAPFIYFVRVRNEQRQEFRDFLSTGGIDTGIHWQPGHAFSLFRDRPRGSLEVTEVVGKEILTLPLHSHMSLDLVDRVCDQIECFFDQ